MMKKIGILIFLGIISILVLRKILKPPHFLNEIKAYQQQDILHKPPENSILFYGSSSITKWKGLTDSFPGYSIIQRGIGGASFPDITRYVDEIVFPYKPKQIFIYCGDNDFAYYENITPEIVSKKFAKLFTTIRKGMQLVNISFISIKPSLSRWNFEAKFIKTNQLIKIFLEKEANTGYVNIHDAMLTAERKVDTTIFESDQLHMNAKGYAIWKKIITPYLKH